VISSPQSLNVEALEISTLRNADHARRGGEYYLHFRFLHRLFLSLSPPVVGFPYHVPITRRAVSPRMHLEAI